MAEKWTGTRLVEPFTFERNGQTVHIIDTPGFDGSTTSDVLLLEDISACLNQAYVHRVQVSGIIYLHAINSPRAPGSAKRALRIVKKICGEEAYPIILLGSSMWDKETDLDLARAREEELIKNHELWGDMIAAGSKSFKFFNDQRSALEACDYIIHQGKRKTLALQNQMIDERKSLDKTDAGIEMLGVVADLQALCTSNLAAARKEAKRAARSQNRELASSLNRSKEGLEIQLYNSKRALESMHGDAEALHARSEAALKAELERLQRNREQNERLRRGIELEAHRLEGRLRSLGMGINGVESASSRKTTSGGNPQSPDEAASLLGKYNDCKRELDLCNQRQDINKHQIDTCLNRIGVGATVLGAAFQVAAVGITVAACTVM